MKSINHYTFDELYSRLPEQLRNAMKECEQDPVWHPEGNAEIHTRLVFEYCQKNFKDVDLLVTAIFHDIAKPITRRDYMRDGKLKISNIGHEVQSIPYLDKYLHLYKDVCKDEEKIRYICKNHLRAHMYKTKKMTKPAKRQELENNKYFDLLMQFEEADTLGKDYGNN